MSLSAAQPEVVFFAAQRRIAPSCGKEFPRKKSAGRAPAHVAPILILAAILSLWSLSEVHAAILIESQVGFRGVFQLGRPFPLEIELNNTGRPIEGVLEVQVWKGGATKGGPPYPVRYRRDLYLGAQSRRKVQFTVDPDFVSRPLIMVFSANGAKVSRELDLRRHFSPAPVRLFVSERSAPPLSLASSLQSRLVSVALAELPADPRALLGVSHLIFYDQSLRDLSRAQLAAIEVWLSAGGRMVILGSLNYALYQEPAISRFLPVRVAGAKQIHFVPSGATGGSAAPVADAWVQLSSVTGGNLLAESQGIPLIVDASRGRGRILYLALDIGRPPLSQWDGLPRLVQELLKPASFQEPALRSDWHDGIFSQLVASPSFIARYVPAGSLLVAMVAYLAGLGAIAWLWQRKRHPRRGLVIILLGLIGAATAGGYAHFNRGGNIPDGVLLSSTVMESSGDGFVEAQSSLALFSTQVREYRLHLERGWMELTPVPSRSRDGFQAAVVRQEGGGASQYQLPLREWDYRLFRMRFVYRFPLRADFEVQGDQLVMKVENHSANDLIDCWLLLPGQRFSLGEIARGARWTKTFPLTNPKNFEAPGYGRADTVSFREVSFNDKIRETLFHYSFFPRDQAVAWNNGAVFFGWVKDPEPRVRSDDPKIQAQGFALYRVLVPLGGGEEE
jgi:hypothetical protein